MVKGQTNETDPIRGDGLLLDDHCCPVGCPDDDYRWRLIGQFRQPVAMGNWRESASSFSTRSIPLPVMDAVQAA